MPVAGHHYSLGAISTSLALVLSCCSTLRSSASIVDMLAPLLSGGVAAPCYVSIRWWLLRLGLYELNRPKESAEDWIWIVDHTMQLGEVKCLIILGIRQSSWVAMEDRRLTHEDVELIDLQPVCSSTGEVVSKQLEDATAKTGTPRAIVSDEGRDLHLGLKLFRDKHPETSWMYDIKHKTASLLKRTLEADEKWKSFVAEVNRTKQKVCLTPLAFLAPPQQRGKARYMNVDTLVAWGQKVLDYLDCPEAPGREQVDTEKLEEKLGWLRGYRQSLASWHQGMAVIEATEHYVRCEGIHRSMVAKLRPQLNALATDALSRSFRDELLAFLHEQSRQARRRERLLGSSEVIESVIGKYKRLQGERSPHGLTSMILSIGSIVGRKTVSIVQKALANFGVKDVLAWCQKSLFKSVQSRRKEAFAKPKAGTKTETKRAA